MRNFNLVNVTKAIHSNPKNQHQRITVRDYYYQREVSAKHMLKVAGFSFAGNVITYFISALIIFLLQFYFAGNMVLVVAVGAVIILPISALLPSFPPYRYLYHLVPRIYSLADDINVWYKKAVKLIMYCEAARFAVGLLPLAFTKYGILTSPFTYYVYTFLYVYPTDSYDRIMLNNQTGSVDVLVFVLAYFAYFAAYEFFILRKIKRYMIRQQEYLEGCKQEREKYYNYNKIKFYD